MKLRERETIFGKLNPFEGKVVGISGGGHGIGKTTVLEILRLGGKVATFTLREDEVRLLQEHAAGYGENLLVRQGDAADGEFAKEFMQEVEEKFGRLDGWVNNALVNLLRPFEDETEEEYRRALEVNLVAPFLWAKLVVPFLEKTQGAMVNMSSIMARLTVGKNITYTSHKAGIEGWTRGMAVELAPKGIRVNAVAPGMIITSYHYLQDGYSEEQKNDPEIIAQKAMYQKLGDTYQPWPTAGMAIDIAETILFLLSDSAWFITGQVVTVDGGRTASIKANNIDY